VDFRLSDDQQELAAGIRSLAAGRLPLEHIRVKEGAEAAISAEDWTLLGQTGVFSLTLPEPAGVGLGLADAVVVFEELGRALIPGPLVGTFLAATAGLVEGAAEGQAQVGVHAGGRGPILIEHLPQLAALLVLPGFDKRSTARLLAPAPRAESARRIDAPLCPLTPMWLLPALAAGDPVADVGMRLVRDGTLLTAALQVGHAAQTLDLAVAYAKERRQFGQPIGGFQAVKHICADMLVRAEVARCAVQEAAAQADAPDVVEFEAEVNRCTSDELVARTAMGAKLLADEAAVANARAAIQVHGGMGFTWEAPLHLHLKRSLVLRTGFGSPTHLAAALSALA
jgi:alkylation response protein AidB-like acyl-CoA dehydrogenase